MDKFHKALVATYVAIATVLIGGGVSYATPGPDPTGGMTTDVESGISDWVAEYGVPMLGALLILGLLIGIGIRFSKRGARAVSGG